MTQGCPGVSVTVVLPAPVEAVALAGRIDPFTDWGANTPAADRELTFRMHANWGPVCVTRCAEEGR